MIAFVHGLRNWGAVERYVAVVAGALGDDALILHPDDPVLTPFAATGARTAAYPSALLDSAPRLARHLRRELRRLRPRAVHVTDVLPPALVAARLAGVRRLFLTHHTPELPREDNTAGRAWLRLGWLARPTVIYTSETDRARDGRSPSVVVPLGIELDRFAAGTPSLEGTIVGNVARLARQKGHDTLQEAARLVRERRPDVRFVVAGEGELRPALEHGPLELLGARDDVPDLLASFDVFAFPSRFEGLCLAVIEAQAAGVPVVATPVGGIRETVLEGETGWLVPPDDPRTLAERLLWVLEHPAEASTVAEAARRRVRDRYGEQAMVERTLALYSGTR